MTEPKFTPGPWQWWTSNSWRRLTAHNGPGGQYDREGNVLCPTVQSYDQHPDIVVSQADMDLIAAAPDMYAALLEARLAVSNAIEIIGSQPQDPEHAALRNIDAAIAKARGGKS